MEKLDQKYDVSSDHMGRLGARYYEGHAVLHSVPSWGSPEDGD
jgi:hypothetical protein